MGGPRGALGILGLGPIADEKRILAGFCVCVGVCRYAFDRVFAKDTTQDEVFEDTAKPLLPGLFDGFNATVFAYGVSSNLPSGTSKNLWFCLTDLVLPPGHRLWKDSYSQRNQGRSRHHLSNHARPFQSDRPRCRSLGDKRLGLVSRNLQRIDPGSLIR